MIKVSNVSFSYNKTKQVLSNVSLEIREGECVILLGPNGAGKSTLINLVLGLLKLKEGTISYDEKNILDVSYKEKAEYIAYVPQLVSETNLTVKETILLGRLPFYKIYPNKADYEEVNSIINEFSLNEIQDKETNQISGGERQKTSIARGFVQDSKVIIFDEPTSNLDIKAQQDVINLIKNEKNKKQKSFLISMHDINQALSIGDRFIFLKNGEVFKECSKDEINETLIEDVYGVKAKVINENGGKYIIYEN